MVARKSTPALQDSDINELCKNLPVNLPATIKQHIEQLAANELSADYAKKAISVLIKLPFTIYKEYNKDYYIVRQLLDQHIYGLNSLKDTIIEHLMGNKYKKNSQTLPYFCLYGKPGIGKTSFCYSLAKALGAEIFFISLPGRHSFSLIGQEQSYRAATYGELIRILIKSKCMNPIIVFDELDKMNTDDMHGSIEAVLLAICDPVSNKSFKDLFLEAEIDISQISFIFTANDPSKISPPLRSRLTMVEVEDYSTEDKVEILQRYLIPNIINEYQANFPLSFASDVHRLIVDSCKIDRVSQELTSGLREIKHFTEQIINKGLFYVEQHKLHKFTISAEWIMNNFPYTRNISSLPDSVPQIVQRNIRRIGTASAVAVAKFPNGSYIGILNAVTCRTKDGDGQLKILGNIGDDSKMAITTALNLIQIHSGLLLGEKKAILQKYDMVVAHYDMVQQHDGSSAGIAYLIAMLSEILQLPLMDSIAFSGGVELDGSISEVGMINEKVQGCIRAKVRTIYVSHRNFCQISHEHHMEIDIIPVGNIFELVNHVFPSFAWSCPKCARQAKFSGEKNLICFEHDSDLFCHHGIDIQI